MSKNFKNCYFFVSEFDPLVDSAEEGTGALPPPSHPFPVSSPFFIVGGQTNDMMMATRRHPLKHFRLKICLEKKTIL